MGFRLYSAVWDKFCGLQKWFAEISKIVCKMVQEFPQKILDLVYLMTPINNVLKHIIYVLTLNNMTVYFQKGNYKNSMNVVQLVIYTKLVEGRTKIQSPQNTSYITSYLGAREREPMIIFDEASHALAWSHVPSIRS